MSLSVFPQMGGGCDLKKCLLKETLSVTSGNRPHHNVGLTIENEESLLW